MLYLLYILSVDNFHSLCAVLFGVFLFHLNFHRTYISHQTVKAQPRHYFLRKLKHAHLPQQLLTNFYQSVTESLLTCCCTVFLQLHNTGQEGPAEGGEDKQSVSSGRHHPLSETFTPLPSGKRYRSIRSETNRLKNSFFSQRRIYISSTVEL